MNRRYRLNILNTYHIGVKYSLCMKGGGYYIFYWNFRYLLWLRQYQFYFIKAVFLWWEHMHFSLKVRWLRVWMDFRSESDQANWTPSVVNFFSRTLDPEKIPVSATPPLTTYRRDWIIIMKVSRNNWWNSFWIINILFSFQTSGQIAFPWILPDKYREGDNSHALRTALELQKKFFFFSGQALTPPPS